MSPNDVLDEFRAAGALLEGHFILSSGRHSAMFFQKAFVFESPARTERLCKALAAKIADAFGPIDVIVAPAVGAIIPGYETARHLGARSLFVERQDGKFALRRGFALRAGERALLLEDVITTGLSLGEALAAIADAPAEVMGAACLIDRRDAGAPPLPLPLVSLAKVDAPSYAPDALPADLAAIPPVKPGSRGLA